jgi:hypothetical protein
MVKNQFAGEGRELLKVSVVMIDLASKNYRPEPYR